MIRPSRCTAPASYWSILCRVKTSSRFRTASVRPGDYAVRVRLDNDALDLDDTRTVIIRVKDHVPVMLVNGKPAAELYDQATEWLKDALNPFQAGLIPRNIAARPRVVSEAQFSDAALGDLTPYDCVFLCDMPQLDAGEVRRLETHLHRGGGVVISLGPRVDLEAYNRLVYRNGDGILPARLIGRQSAPPKSYFNLFAGSDDKDYKDPPLNAFTDIRDRETLRSARFHEYVRAELAPGGRARKILSFLPEASTASASSQERGNVSPLPAGDPALVEWARYRGRVVLFTSTINMDWTTWPVSPSFPALMQELLHFAVAGRLREQRAVVGDVLEEYLPPAAGGLAFTLHTPDGRIESGHTQPQAEVGVLRWTDTDISGVYRATIGQRSARILVCRECPDRRRIPAIFRKRFGANQSIGAPGCLPRLGLSAGHRSPPGRSLRPTGVRCGGAARACDAGAGDGHGHCPLVAAGHAGLAACRSCARLAIRTLQRRDRLLRYASRPGPNHTRCHCRHGREPLSGTGRRVGTRGLDG